MSETNKSLRIRTTINDTNPSLYVNLDQTYNTFEILSLKLSQEDVYKLHSANYGVIVGRVLANGNFGVPNAKISIFIEGDFENEEISTLYPYTSTASQDKNGIKYNLLPDEKIDDCHQVVGTFPNKTYVLDNDVLIEVFDKYYKYTTRTNNSGDYIIAGVPTGNQTLHMDLDLSDCGILSQRPRDFVYKGYTIEQFENANQFKTDTNLESLSQIFSQDQVVNVIPFWGNENQGETIGITRADINISFRFEPTCVFMGSVVADNSSNGISKKCVPTNQMGAMDELTTGEGTIEMIRYTPGGDIEEFQIKGTQLIDGNGVWCYQIPMNLDYMMTDEYGNMVPTDDQDKGIPTRTRVRFRISMHDMEKNTDNYFRAKVLVPHNPQMMENGEYEDYDYEFGSNTKEDSFRDLLWNNVYTVKSYVPRFQKSKTSKETARFTGIKHCNYYGNNNPIPYNNIRIKLPLMFMILCALIKVYIKLLGLVNGFIYYVTDILSDVAINLGWLTGGKAMLDKLVTWKYSLVSDGLCPDLENWYFAPVTVFNRDARNAITGWQVQYHVPFHTYYYDLNLLKQTFESLTNESGDYYTSTDDSYSIDYANRDSQDAVCLTVYTDYLIACIEMALAQEYKVINFDFYNDWLNGVIYMPRWMRFVRPKRKYLFGLITIKSKIKACMDDTSIFNKTRYYVQQCSLSYGYDKTTSGYTKVTTDNGCVSNSNKQKCHKKNGKSIYGIFGGSRNSKQPGNGGIVHENETMKGQYVYYLKPCEWRLQNGKKVNLFANDIVLLGSLLDCNIYGIPQAFKYLTSSSYVMPTNLALTNMDDEGYLYADGNGTICSKNENWLNIVREEQNDFTGTAKYYSKSDEPISYGKITGDNLSDVFDDSIPLTEAAGIAWNYTGPGQGVKSDDVRTSLYMPGGHFLGISCVNSETNIKSCINLERICEVGSNMSQRREEIRRIDNTNSLYYRYFVPTGLIANDEVNGGAFRNMFATMNQKKLLCKNHFDEKTGYPIYDFVYLRPNGFDGGLSNQINGDTFGYWNNQINVKEESGSTAFDGVAIDINYDKEETSNTYTRTVEETKSDYYKFRLGINTSLEDKDYQRSKFLIDNGNSVKLPQYENSFYFYFGLRDGATAFDEFNKQFFSVCDSSSIIKKNFNIEISSEETDECLFTQKVSFNITEANGIVSGYYEYENECGEKVKSETIYIQTTNGEAQYVLNGISFGKYTFNLTDENGANIVKTFEIGKNLVTGNFTSKPFEFRTSGMSPSNISISGQALDCGYIKLESFKYFEHNDVALNTIINNLVILESTTKKAYGSKFNHLSPCIINGYSTGLSVRIGSDGKIYVPKADVYYEIYLFSTSNSCYGYTYLGNVYVEGIDNYDLYLGSKLLSYSEILSKPAYDYNTQWWLGIGGDTVMDWAKRYALFKRIDDLKGTFTNKIFAVNSQNRVIDTVLFGQPENEDGLFSGITGIRKVYYENDNNFDSTYSLSDISIIPTTLSSGVTGNNRELFGEMAVNGSAVISDKLGTYTVTSGTNAEGNYFEITSGTISNKIKDGHGCIAKFNDGTLLYPVRVGNKFYFDGEMPETNSLSLYPIFYYPVMYRPFYVNFYAVEWNNRGYEENISTTGERDYVVNNNVLSCNCAISVKNGLTFNHKFKNLVISNKNIDSYDAYYNDVYGLTSAYTYTDRSNDRTIECANLLEGEENNVTTYGYEVQENGPETGDCSEEVYQKLTTPYSIVLNTLSDSINTDGMCTDIYYYESEDMSNKKIISDKKNTDESVQYYLVKATGTPVTVEEYTRTNINDSSNQFIYLYEFTEDSDAALQVERAIVEGKEQPVNIGYVDIFVNDMDSTSVTSCTATFAYYSTSEKDVLLNKNVQVTGSNKQAKEESLKNALAQYAIVPIITKRWKQEENNGVKANSASTVINFFKGLINTPIADNSSADTITLNNSYRGKFSNEISKDTILDYYVVGYKKNSANVTENSTTELLKVYTNIIVLNDYEGGGVSPELTLIPSGEEGVYDDKPHFIANLVVNGSSTNTTIEGDVSSFEIETTPSLSETYTVTVNGTTLTSTTASYSGTYNCGENPGSSIRQFEVIASNGVASETIIVTQNPKSTPPFSINLKVNGTSDNVVISSATTGFTINTYPSTEGISYNVYLNGNILNSGVQGNYIKEYTCGVNTAYTENVFEISAGDGDDRETIVVTQGAQPEPFKSNLKINGSSTAITIDSGTTGFTITTEPNHQDYNYDVYVNGTKITGTSGNFRYTYECGVNDDYRNKTFVVKTQYNTDIETISVTQRSKPVTTYTIDFNVGNNSSNYITFYVEIDNKTHRELSTTVSVPVPANTHNLQDTRTFTGCVGDEVKFTIACSEYPATLQFEHDTIMSSGEALVYPPDSNYTLTSNKTTFNMAGERASS